MSLSEIPYSIIGAFKVGEGGRFSGSNEGEGRFVVAR